MCRLPTHPLVWLLSIWGSVACSSSEAPTPTALSLAPNYHLKAVDGVLLPIPIQGTNRVSLDSGQLVVRGTTVQIVSYSHSLSSSNTLISVGAWTLGQSGNTVVLFPQVPFPPPGSSRDTAFIGTSDTLTLHNRESGVLHVEVYVAP